jgi:hypothetical protein
MHYIYCVTSLVSCYFLFLQAKELQDCSFESDNELNNSVNGIFIDYRTKVFHVSLITGKLSGVRYANDVNLVHEDINPTKNNAKICI